MLDGAEVVDIQVAHAFTPGLYSRTITIPAGTLLTSKVHKTEHPFILLSGVLRVFIEEQGEVVELAGPHRGVTKAGTRRVAYAVTECTWTTFHATDETDLGAIEGILIEPHFVGGVNLHQAYLDRLVAKEIAA